MYVGRRHNRIFRVEPCCLQVKPNLFNLYSFVGAVQKNALNGISVATGFAVAMTAVLLLAVLLLIGSPYSNAFVFAAACNPAVR